MSNETEQQPQKQPYVVLARKYRPQNFDELIGQDALVRTLKNAIEMDRVAHAFMLTGVRGIGKTTTARIIAKALNYKGPDGNSGPTTGPTDDCEICKAISEDRHPDVIEMDAASRTGIDDIREILDGVRYAPVEARYKIYIIDEVHMLSKQAFNGLLKTLEEPPPHVKFIFATTEIRKIPVTILSRCQTFSLKRLDETMLAGHYTNICQKENVEIDEAAAAIIARAADGSVRDGLSMLDQAISMCDSKSGAKITQDLVEKMLGVSDRTVSIDLIEHLFNSRTENALATAQSMYEKGTEALLIVQDLLDLVHALTKMNVVKDQSITAKGYNADQAKRLQELADKLTMAHLGKVWQLLLKGLEEIKIAPYPQQSLEVLLIRFCYAAQLPDPGDLMKKLKSDNDGGQAVTNAGQHAQQAQRDLVSASSPSYSAGGAQTSAQIAQHPQTEAETARSYHIQNLQDIYEMLNEEREPVLADQVYRYVQLVKIANGRLDINLLDDADMKLSNNLGKALQHYTGQRWVVTISNEAGQQTLYEQDQERLNAEKEKVMAAPLVAEVFKTFSNAKIVDIFQKD